VAVSTTPPSRNTVGNAAGERGVACGLERGSACGLEHGWGNTAVHVARNVVGNMVHEAGNVFHSDWLKEIVNQYPGYPFRNIPLIFDDSELMNTLKTNVTLDPAGDMLIPSGIPPHITHSIALQRVIGGIDLIQESVCSLESTIVATIKSAIDDKVRSEGNVNLTILNESLASFSETFMTEMKQTCRDLAVAASPSMAA